MKPNEERAAMKPFKIGRIHIRNFKSIIEFEQTFHRDLMIFDGPNGFGKTTIFDSLELIMFGRIKRIDDYKIVDQKQGYRDSLYFNDPDQDVLIQVQFYSEEKTYVVTKRLPSRKKTRKKPQVSTANAPTAWNQFETYITDDFVDQFETFKPVSQEQVHEHLDVTHLMRAFHLFYYIQQEEKTHFIKSTEKDRLKALSDLFDTKKEEEERKKLEEVCKVINKRLDALDTEIDALKETGDTAEAEGINTNHVTPYSSLITQKGQPLWDKELTSVTPELRQKSHEELDLLKDLVLNVQAFEAATFNRRLSNYIDNQNLMQATVILFAHLSINPTQFREKEQLLKDYRLWFNRLAREHLVDEINRDGVYEALLKIVNTQHWPIKEEALFDLINQIRQQRRNSSELENIVVQINDTRNALFAKNKQFLD